MQCFSRAGLVAAGLVLVTAVAAPAQVERAALSGTVKDASDAVLAGVTIKVRNVETNVALETVSEANGGFSVLSLIPGQYELEATLSGFQTSKRRINLQVGQRVRVDLTLGLAGVEQAVTVEGTAPMLSTEAAEVGTVISRSEVQKLPLSLRNWDDLVGLAAGVQGDRYTEQAGSTAAGRTGGVTVHGARSLQNNFLLDGLDNNSISTNVQELTTQVARPSVDAIAEFKVVTSPYSAEYGRAPGAAISVTTKSGTNAFRGTAYEYNRNDRFNSIDFFTNRQGAPKPDYSMNSFGGNLGGPIVRNRAFFFGDYEGTHLKQGVTRQTVVPTELERQGIFFSSIKDPTTGLPFQNNRIPADRIDPVAAKIMALFPSPNASGANNYFRTAEATDDADRYLTRFDLQLSSNDNVFARYSYSNRDRFIPGNFGGQADGTSTSAWGRQNMKAHGLAVGWNRTITSTLLNEFRVGYSRADSHAVQDPFGQNSPADFGIKGVPDDPRINGGLPGINFSAGGYRLGSPDFLPKYQITNQVQIVDTVSWLRGDHQVKLGADLMMPMSNDFLDVPALRGSLTFRNTFTGNVLADFLLGYVSDAQLSNVAEVRQRLSAYSFFLQDDWKATPKVTVNMGLRYDFMSPAFEADNRMANFDPSTGGLVYASDGSLQDRALVEPDRNNFSPRIGVVYSVSQSLIVRTGYGLFYDLFDRIGSEDQLGLNPPNLINNSLQASGGKPLFFLEDGFPADFLDPARLDLRRVRVRAVDPTAKRSYLQQWSVGAQKTFGNAYLVSADYVGTKGQNLATLRNLNQPDPVTKALPYPTVGPVEYRDDDGRSNYQGLELAFERRFSSGIGFRAAYTLSESKDNTGEHLFSGGSPSFLQDARNRESWYGPADWDTRHRFAVNWIYELPFGQGRRWVTEGVAAHILGNFTFSGIITSRSGRPFTVTQSSNNVGQLMTGLPNGAGDGKGQENVDSWFDVTAFQAVPSGTFGNSRRNILRGPGLTNVDLALHRGFPIGGSRSFQFRWEIFNALNTTQLGLPEANLSNRAVGTISRLAGDPRVMQFAVRFLF